RIVEELSTVITDPVSKLKFLRQALNEYTRIPRRYRLFPPLAEIAFRVQVLSHAEAIAPGSQANARELMRRKIISAPRNGLLKIYKCRHAIATLLGGFFLWGLGTSVASLVEMIQTAAWKPYSVFEGTLSPPVNRPPGLTVFPVPSQESAAPLPDYIENSIWLVEKTPSTEIYSNRLQIITTHTVENIPRRYYRFPRTTSDLPAADTPSGDVAGILFHASESDLLPFKPEMNQSIQRYSRSLVQYLQRIKAYHYFIDRFGRVYRIVREDHAAFHAGNSVWADEGTTFLDLNHAFVGICFEGRDFEDKPVATDENAGGVKFLPVAKTGTLPISETQIASGRELTDWLRFKYRISQQNCVPHGLASVNPSKMLIGFHLDLSHGFPFHSFGLRNKYDEPLPSVTEFGFAYDRYFVEILKGNVWPGLQQSEIILRQQAKLHKMSLRTYQKRLHRHYARLFEWQSTQRLDEFSGATSAGRGPSGQDEAGLGLAKK
ncbi:MAG: N-acetylmuramoyl-L-alanine amidase, partial [Desulfobacterales bacterium]|nr:N-acetylmuramoyl-L-alanine amidase [Desulfobacterales bacterium]